MDERALNAGGVIVTGASGFTGRHACRIMASAGWKVTAVCSPRTDPEFWRGLSAAGGECCDLTDGPAVRRLIGKLKPDAVLHLAGQNAVEASWREPSDTLMRNLIATVHLLEAVRAECPECRIVAAGSMVRPSIDRLMDTANPYAFSKTLQFMAAKAWHRWHGMDVIVVEPTNLIGPGGSSGICGRIAKWAAEAEAGGAMRPFKLSSLREKRDFLDVRDAVSAYELLLRAGTPGGDYALESGTFRSLEELKTAFDQEAACELAWEIGDAAANNPAPRDTSPIRKLGWRPKIDFRQSVKDALEEERKRVRPGRLGERP